MLEFVILGYVNRGYHFITCIGATGCNCNGSVYVGGRVVRGGGVSGGGVTWHARVTCPLAPHISSFCV